MLGDYFCYPKIGVVTVMVLWLFLTVPWVGSWCVAVVFPDHTHLRFCCELQTKVALDLEIFSILNSL